MALVLMNHAYETLLLLYKIIMLQTKKKSIHYFNNSELDLQQESVNFFNTLFSFK